MKYYYGNNIKEALTNIPIDITTVDELQKCMSIYSIVISVDSVNLELTKVIDNPITVSQETQQVILSCYESNKDVIEQLKAHEALVEEEVSTDFEEGYGSALKFVMDLIGIKYDKGK